MNQRAELVAAIQKASTFQEQTAAVAQLDAYDRQARQAHEASRSWDAADTVVRETLTPVAVHERDTHETDWLGDVTASSENDQNVIMAEASLWYRRTSDEVKADSDEFHQQAQGVAQRFASQYGEQAHDAKQQFLEYVSFLRQREGASGLPQVEQLVDSQENPGQQPLPEDVFDNFAPPVHPINEGVSGTETSERNPMWQAIGEGGQGQPENPDHHDTAPEPYSYAEVPPQDPQQMQSRQSSLDEDYAGPSVAINHMATLDDFRAQFEREALEENSQSAGTSEWGKNPQSATTPYGKHPYPEGEEEDAEVPNPLKSPSSNDVGKEGSKQAASGLPQVQQIVDSFENPDPKQMPQDVAFPWTMDEEDEGAQTTPDSEKRQAVQRRAAYVAGLLQKDPLDVTPREAQEIRAFTASLNKRADQWSQPHQVPGGGQVANNPGTTPEPQQGSFGQGYSEGQGDWRGEQAPTYSDDSSHASDFVRGHSEGYGDAARADEHARQGEVPRGAGNSGYETHTGSRTASRKQADYIDEAGKRECQSCGHTSPPVLADTGPACRQCGSYSLKRRGSREYPMPTSGVFTSRVEREHPDFAKGYAYASRWDPSKPLVTTGSAEFEAGLYAGITDNPQQQHRWADAHQHTAKRYEKPEFTHRMRLHSKFSQKVAQTLPNLRVQGAYVVSEEGPHHTTPNLAEARHTGARHTTAASKVAGTTQDLDTVGPQTSPSPSGSTPINGPGRPGPLAGGQDPAAPGGPAPYNAAPPYGQQVVPNGRNPKGQPGHLDTTPGGPVDRAALEHLSPQTHAFRKRVQASLLKSHQNGSR